MTPRSGTASPSRGSGTAVTCAWPTSSGPASRARSTCSACSWSPWASRIAEVTSDLFARDAYRDYLELHGLSVQLTESLAEYWHKRMRAELGLRRRGPGPAGGLLRPALPRCAVLLRLRGLPEPRGPGQAGRPARAGADRRQALRGVPAAPRAVDRRARAPPPGGDLLQREVTARARYLLRCGAVEARSLANPLSLVVPWRRSTALRRRLSTLPSVTLMAVSSSIAYAGPGSRPPTFPPGHGVLRADLVLQVGKIEKSTMPSVLSSPVGVFQPTKSAPMPGSSPCFRRSPYPDRLAQRRQESASPDCRIQWHGTGRRRRHQQDVCLSDPGDPALLVDAGQRGELQHSQDFSPARTWVSGPDR